MFFFLAALAFVLIIVAAAAAAAAIAWHLLTYRLPGDLNVALATFFLAIALVLTASTVASFLAVPWDNLTELLARLTP